VRILRDLWSETLEGKSEKTIYWFSYDNKSIPFPLDTPFMYVLTAASGPIHFTSFAHHEIQEDELNETSKFPFSSPLTFDSPIAYYPGTTSHSLSMMIEPGLGSVMEIAFASFSPLCQRVIVSNFYEDHFVITSEDEDKNEADLVWGNIKDSNETFCFYWPYTMSETFVSIDLNYTSTDNSSGLIRCFDRMCNNNSVLEGDKVIYREKRTSHEQEYFMFEPNGISRFGLLDIWMKTNRSALLSKFDAFGHGPIPGGLTKTNGEQLIHKLAHVAKVRHPVHGPFPIPYSQSMGTETLSPLNEASQPDLISSETPQDQKRRPSPDDSVSKKERKEIVLLWAIIGGAIAAILIVILLIVLIIWVRSRYLRPKYSDDEPTSSSYSRTTTDKKRAGADSRNDPDSLSLSP
jgi:hypothetical protein